MGVEVRAEAFGNDAVSLHAASFTASALATHFSPSQGAMSRQAALERPAAMNSNGRRDLGQPDLPAERR
jgi:hypothetical protein